MAPLDTRTSHRILVLWLAWFGLLAALVVVNARREWQRQAPARGSAASGVATGESERLKASPEQHTDLVYSVVLDNGRLLKLVLVLVGPPAILTPIWLYLRRRWEPGPPP